MSLTDRLRLMACEHVPGAFHDQVADALDAKDAEIVKLRAALGEAIDAWESDDRRINDEYGVNPWAEPERMAELRKLVAP